MKVIFTLCSISIFCLAFQLRPMADNNQKRIESIVIDVTGDNFNWHFRYPGKDGILGNDDDQHSVRNLYLPDHSNVKLKLHSNDYLYSFALPSLSLKEIAVPGLDYELSFSTVSEDKMPLLGDQFCGFSHKTLIGEVSIRNQDHGFYGWKN